MSTKQPLLPVLAFMAACAFSVAAMGADAPKPAAPNVTRLDSAGSPPFIVHNPDGTMTVQKNPSRGKAEDAGHNELVVPPQVVVPLLRVPAKDPRN
jgi:hypothetical protein